MDRNRRHLVSSIRFFKDRVLRVRVAKQLLPTQQLIQIPHSKNHDRLLSIDPFLHLWIATVFVHELSQCMARLHHTLATREIASHQNEQPRAFTHSPPPVASPRRPLPQSDQAACAGGYRVSATGGTKNTQAISAHSKCGHANGRSASRAEPKSPPSQAPLNRWPSESKARPAGSSHAASHFDSHSSADDADTCTIRLFQTSLS